ncbi:MAG: CvpA family protein [Alphaproteobacteria bacterium]
MIIDLIVIVIVLISALIAFMRGLIREVLTIAGVLGGLAASYFGGPFLKPLMRGWFGVTEEAEPARLFDIIPYSLLADALSYGLIFIIVVIILSIISHTLAETARALGLGPVDRTLGVVFGILRGVFLLGLMYLPFSLVLDKEVKESWFEGSKTFFYVEKVADFLADLIPQKDLEKLEESAQQVEDANKENEKEEDEEPSLREKLMKLPLPEGTDTPANEDGYNKEFRQDLDQLFENPDEPAEEKTP